MEAATSMQDLDGILKETDGLVVQDTDIQNAILAAHAFEKS